MSLQFDTTTRNAWLTTLNTNIGTSAVLEIRSGSVEANCAAADSGTLIASLTCNAGGFGSVSGGVLTAAAISTATAGASATAAHFRLKDSGGTTVHTQGNIATSASDLNITNTSINSGDTVSVTSWTITAPGA